MGPFDEQRGLRRIVQRLLHVGIHQITANAFFVYLTVFTAFTDLSSTRCHTAPPIAYAHLP